MHARLIVTLAVVVSGVACASATSVSRTVLPGQSIQLAVGESATVASGPVRVRFADVNDSRCPSDVVCVWAGDAMIILTFTGAGAERTDTVSLTRSPKSAAYGGFQFEALDVQPYPRSGQTAAKVLALRVNGPV